MALGLTQQLTEISTRNTSWEVKRPVGRADNLPPSCADCFEIWEPLGLSRHVIGLLYLLPLQKYEESKTQPLHPFCEQHEISLPQPAVCLSGLQILQLAAALGSFWSSKGKDNIAATASSRDARLRRLDVSFSRHN